MQIDRKRDDQRQAIIEAMRRGELTVVEVAERSGLARMTIWRWLRAAKIDPGAARTTRANIVWWRILSGKRRSRASKQMSADRAMTRWSADDAEQ